MKKRSSRTVRHQAGITLPEVVIAASGLLVLASLTGGWIGQRHLGRQIDQAYWEIRDIHAASMRFYREYGQWPAPRVPTGGDAHLGVRTANAEAMNRLRSVEGPGNVNHEGNPRRIDFFQAVLEERELSIQWTDQGEGLDPWGNPYRMAYDTDFNGVLELRDTYSDRLPGQGLVVWSPGPDREPGTRRDIRSWQ